MNKGNWNLELSTYIKEGNLSEIEKTKAWETAIGLQEVDGLEPSKYLLCISENSLTYGKSSGKNQTKILTALSDTFSVSGFSEIININKSKNKNKKRKNRIPETNPLNTNCDNVSSNLFEI